MPITNHAPAANVRANYGTTVATVAALRAVTASERFSNQLVYVSDVDATYEFEPASVAVDDGDLFLEPDDSPATGRWEKRGAGIVAPAAHAPTHISAGGDAFLSTDLLEAIVKRLQTTTGPTTLLLGAVADGEFLRRSGTALVGAAAMTFPTILYMADQLSLPNSADWVVNALAALDQDPVNDGFPAILYDDAGEEGRGLEFIAPAATNLIINVLTRAVSVQGGAVVAKMRAYNRGIALTPAVIEAWSAAQTLTDVDLPITTRFPHYDETTISYASLGIVAGELTQLEITRNSPDAGDTLVGDLALLAVILSFT